MRFDIRVTEKEYKSIIKNKKYRFSPDMIVNIKDNKMYPLEFLDILSESNKSYIRFCYGTTSEDLFNGIQKRSFVVFHVIPINKYFKYNINQSDLIILENGVKELKLNEPIEMKSESLVSNDKDSVMVLEDNKEERSKLVNKEVNKTRNKMKKKKTLNYNTGIEAFASKKNDAEKKMLQTLLNQAKFSTISVKEKYDVLELRVEKFNHNSTFISMLFKKNSLRIGDAELRKSKYVLVYDRQDVYVYTLVQYKLHKSSVNAALQLQISKITTEEANEIKKEIRRTLFVKITSVENTKTYLVYKHRELQAINENINKYQLNNNVLDELQIIDSTNNHVTKRHRHVNKVMYIEYFDGKVKKKSGYKCHYCIECEKYFDFKSSFDSQMKEKSIHKTSLVTRIVDQRGLTLNFENEIFDNLDNNSPLTALGYHVGYTGLTKYERQLLLKKIIDEKKLTISQIKNIINTDISRFQNIKRYELAVIHWKEDLIYLNDRIQ